MQAIPDEDDAADCDMAALVPGIAAGANRRDESLERRLRGVSALADAK